MQPRVGRWGVPVMRASLHAAAPHGLHTVSGRCELRPGIENQLLQVQCRICGVMREQRACCGLVELVAISASMFKACISRMDVHNSTLPFG